MYSYMYVACLYLDNCDTALAWLRDISENIYIRWKDVTSIRRTHQIYLAWMNDAGKDEEIFHVQFLRTQVEIDQQHHPL